MNEALQVITFLLSACAEKDILIARLRQELEAVKKEKDAA